MKMNRKTISESLILLIILSLIITNFISCEILNAVSGVSDSESDTDMASMEFTAPPITIINENESTTDNVTENLENTVMDPLETEPTIVGKDLSISGTIDPKPNDLLKLHINWKVEQTSDNEMAKLVVTVYIDCYAIYVRPRTNTKLTVNGDTQVFSTDVISNENNSRSSFQLITKEYLISNSFDSITTVDISAAYYFGGPYGGEVVNWVEADGTIILDQGEYSSEANPLAPELPDFID